MFRPNNINFVLIAYKNGSKLQINAPFVDAKSVPFGSKASNLWWKKGNLPKMTTHIILSNNRKEAWTMCAITASRQKRET